MNTTTLVGWLSSTTGRFLTGIDALFNKKTPPINGFTKDYHFLSNFYPSPLTYNGILYPTAEHAYQAQKTDSPKIREKIASLPTPGAAKRYGKKIDADLGSWDGVKRYHMQAILNIKFSDPVLQKKLKDTGKAYLEETNYWGDTYWGVCNGTGKNHLGHILMEIRAEIPE